jgi:hypothetical protein
MNTFINFKDWRSMHNFNQTYLSLKKGYDSINSDVRIIIWETYYAPRKISGEHIVVGLSVRQSDRMFVPNSCPANNFVIWSQILQTFHRNVHHIKTTWCAQHLGRYIEGQGHSMTLQRNRVRHITSLFEVRFYYYFTEMITMLRRRVMRNIWVVTWKVKVTAWPCSKIMSGQ